VTLARVEEGGRVAPALVQVDSHYTLHKAERGRPSLAGFAGNAWNARGVDARHPIAASFTTCDTDLPQIRVLMDPEIPVVRGIRKIR
jgi:hypothetical protein